MKKLILTVAAAVLALSLGAQAPQPKVESPYQFTMVNDNKTTSVKDQSRSGTCWSYSGVAFLENELLRTGKGDYDISEMWIVRNAYMDKAARYARLHGKSEFSQGGSTHDVFNMIKKYGIVPEEVYAGLQYGTKDHQHSELEAVMKGYMAGLIKNPNGKLSTAWQDGLNGILDAYLGEIPEKFTYKGKEYTPETFAKSLGLNMDDYVSITSFSHHPFYTQFAVEVPDNWALGTSYNVPLDEMMQVINNALTNGYSIDWAADVSEPGFQYAKGYAVIPSDKVEDMSATERAKWETLSSKEKKVAASEATEPITELVITQEMRQNEYDNYTTTDDHGMLITGLAKDQNGKPFYKVKNSWNTDNIYDGYFYASYPFVAAKTLNVVVHKDALPKEIKKKLGIK